MSTSSDIEISYLRESTYGVTPGAGNFEKVRHNGTDSFTGTPQTRASDEVRDDRQPAGSIMLGLNCSGGVTGNLAPTQWVKDWMESAMRQAWSAKLAPAAASLDITTSATKVVRAAGSFATDGFKVGDLVQLTGFSNSDNNTFVYVSAVAALELTIVGPASMADESGSGDEQVIRHAYAEIGNTEFPMSINKKFNDLTGKAIGYRGQLVDTMQISVQGNQPATIQFGTVGGGDDPYAPGTDLTSGHTVNAAGTEAGLNSAQHVGLLVVDGVRVGYCVQSISINHGNNFQGIPCVGNLAPKGFDAGEASVNFTVAARITDANFDLHQAKINDTRFGFVFPVVNDSGEGFAFAIPSARPTFADAAGSGKNAPVIVNIAGTAEPTDELNAFRVYNITQS